MYDIRRSTVASLVWVDETSNGTAPSSNEGSLAAKHPCNVSMLWNWDINDCFITDRVHATNELEFSLLCLGIVLLAIILELLRRLARVYDRAIIKHQGRRSKGTAVPGLPGFFVQDGRISWSGSLRPSIWEQMSRAILHTLIFATSYLLIGLALSFNGYIIVCIMAGTWIGSFAFGRDSLLSDGRGGFYESD